MQLILGTHSQKLCKFCFTNSIVSLEEVVNINSCDIPSSKTSMQNSKVQLQKFIANIKIDNVKVKFLVNTRGSPNIWCYETLNEISKLNMDNYKLKKTSVQLISFRSSSQNSFIGVKGALSVLLETEEHFGNAMFYVIENNVTNIPYFF